MKCVAFALLGLCWLVLASSPVHASPITFTFTGTVTGVASDDLALGVTAGTPITGSYTFDSSAPNVNPPTGSASYQMNGSPLGFMET